MANLYNNHPTVSHTLRQFCNRANHLYNEHATDEPYIRFVLTGEYLDDGGTPKQAFVDPVQNLVEPYHPLSVSRDYDSLLGVAEKILVDGPITVFAVPHSTFALRTSLHMEHPIVRGDVSYSLIVRYQVTN